MLMSRILRKATGGRRIWWCTGCNRAHAVRITALSDPAEDFGPGGSWNADTEQPTFAPSVLVAYNGADAGQDSAPPAVCHSFVQEGQMKFLDDCTHALAGQTVPIPPWPTGDLT